MLNDTNNKQRGDFMTETLEATGLSHWASYLINNDDSALTVEDKAQADKFRQWLGGDIVDCRDAGFMWNHDGIFVAGALAGDCQIYIALTR
jgi:hypothetical protein